MRSFLIGGFLSLAMAACAPAATPDQQPAEVQARPAYADGRISVTVRGEGADVLLIPGLASTPAVWARTADMLDDAHRVHLVQVKGFGGAPAGANASGPVVAPVVEAVAAYAAANKLKRPAVIGHSLGGEAALMLAARHPEAVGRVMVVDALPFFSLLMNPQATPESVKPQADGARAMMQAMGADAFRMSQTAAMGRLVKSPEARARHAAASAASDQRVVAEAMHEIMTTDLRPELGRITAPVTVLYAYDPTYGVPVTAIDGIYARAYAGLNGARLVRVDDAYHFLMDDQPERFAAEVKAFLAP